MVLVVLDRISASVVRLLQMPQALKCTLCLRGEVLANRVRKAEAQHASGMRGPQFLILGRTYGRILDFSFLGVEQTMVTKWYSNWSPGLIFGSLYTNFRA